MGNIGIALAAYFLHENYNVTIWNRSTAKRLKLKNINFKINELRSSSVPKIHYGDLRTLKLANMIIVVTSVANAHEEIIQGIKNTINHNNIVIIIPGCFGSYYEFRKHLNTDNIFEINPSPISSRVSITENTINMKLNNDYYIGGLFFQKDVYKLFPKGEFVSPIQSSLMNIEMILHPAIYLTTKYDLKRFYCDGINLYNEKIINAVDSERLELGLRIGIKLPSIIEILKNKYASSNLCNYPSNMVEIFTKTKPFIDSNIRFNRLDQKRYISEEVPFRLVPMYRLGRDFGLSMKHTKLLIDMAIKFTNVDYYKIKRNVSKSDIVTNPRFY